MSCGGSCHVAEVVVILGGYCMSSQLTGGLAACCFLIGIGIAMPAVFSPVAADDTGLAKALHPMRYERGKLCMRFHYHHGVGKEFKSRRGARASAARAWSAFVTAEYGSDWGRFRRAGSRTMRCQKAAGIWQCNARARPCRRRR